MFGKHYDTRPQKNFIHIYTRVPYLDTEIFNIEVNGLRESRRTRQRTERAVESLERTKKKSETLEENLRNSRQRQIEDEKNFIQDIEKSQKECLDKEKIVMKNLCEDLHNSRMSYIKDQNYLNDLLASNSTKAASRITTVRRWNWFLQAFIFVN